VADGVWVPVLCALMVGAGLSLECWGLMKWLGVRFEKIDASARAALD
jgi:hypothetical protein